MEEFMRRISLSKYRENLVFKGGFLLTSVFGLHSRTTKDIDLLVQKQRMSDHNIIIMFEEIIAAEHDKDVHFEINEIREIQRENQYDGYSVTLSVRMFNIKEKFSIDVVTGDPITPSKVIFPYTTLIKQESIHIYAYTMETVIAEKIHAVYHKGISNSRCKDFYDLYMISKLKKADIKTDNLLLALQHTFLHRKTDFDENDILKQLDQIEQNEFMNVRWKTYAKKHPYAEGISFNETLDSIRNLLREAN